MPLLSQSARLLALVAECGSIRAAAERIGLAPSAVNRHVLNLEAEFGQPLMVRHARGMAPTEAGRLVLDRVQDWQAEDGALRDDLAALAGRHGRVRLGVMECFADRLVPEAFSRLTERLGPVSLELFVGGTVEVADRLHSGALDLALAFGLPQEPGLRLHFEADHDIGLVLRAAPGQGIPPDLRGLRVVLPDRSLTLEPILREKMAHIGLEARAIARSNSVAALKALVRSGVGASFLTRLDVLAELESGELLFLPLAGRAITERLCLASRGGRPLADSTRHLAGILSDALRGLQLQA